MREAYNFMWTMKINYNNKILCFFATLGLFSVLFFRVSFSSQYYYGTAIFLPFLYIGLISMLVLSIAYFLSLNKFFVNDMVYFSSFLILVYILLHFLSLSKLIAPHEFLLKYKTDFFDLPVNVNIIGAFIFVVFNVIFPQFIHKLLKFELAKRYILIAGYVNLFIAITQWFFFTTGVEFFLGVYRVGVGGSDGLIYHRASGLFTNPFPFAVFMIVVSWLSMLKIKERVTIKSNFHTFVFLLASFLSNSKTAIVISIVLILLIFFMQNKIAKFWFSIFGGATLLAIISLLKMSADVSGYLRILDASQYSDISRLSRLSEAIPAILESPIFGYGYDIQFYTDNIILYLLLSGGLIHLFLWFLFAFSPFLAIKNYYHNENASVGRISLSTYFLFIIIIQIIQSTITSSYYSIPNWFVIILVFYYVRQSFLSRLISEESLSESPK